MELSVVVPAYKEGHRIRANVEKIIAFLAKHFTSWEVIVVDDGSNDGTREAVAGLKGVVYLPNEMNRGKGFSVRRGILEARYDPVLFTDADVSTPIGDALALYQAIEAGADVAIGTRILHGTKLVRRTLARQVMALGFRLLVKAIVVRGFRDTQCGFKMFRLPASKELLALQSLERWGFDVELLFLARRKGLRVVEVPVGYLESSESRLKLSTPLTMFKDLLQIRWNALLGRYGRASTDRAEPRNRAPVAGG